ncbi:MAG TPA: hypothetical protein VGB37_00990 [Candidatus Lokiarchaeia archaeon]
MRNDIYKDGKQFSKDYQPPNENKRVPKIKTRIKNIINQHWDIFEEMIKGKNTAAWKMAIDEISEKTSKIDITSKGESLKNMPENEIDDLISEKIKLLYADKPKES